LTIEILKNKLFTIIDVSFSKAMQGPTLIVEGWQGSTFHTHLRFPDGGTQHYSIVTALSFSKFLPLSFLVRCNTPYSADVTETPMVQHGFTHLH
jgi:hypothetical protein